MPQLAYFPPEIALWPRGFAVLVGRCVSPSVLLSKLFSFFRSRWALARPRLARVTVLFTQQMPALGSAPEAWALALRRPRGPLPGLLPALGPVSAPAPHGVLAGAASRLLCSLGLTRRASVEARIPTLVHPTHLNSRLYLDFCELPRIAGFGPRLSHCFWWPVWD